MTSVRNILNPKEPNYQVIKGLLILFVLLDHNNYIRNLMPDFISTLNFHVVGFLVLPILLNKKKVSFSNIGIYFVRYYFVFIIFYTFTLAMNVFVLGNGFDLSKIITSLITGSMVDIERSVGLSMLWFLPSLFSMVVMVTIYNSIEKYRLILIILMFISHLYIGLWEYKQNLPLGFGPVMYVFSLGLIIKIIIDKLKQVNPFICLFGFLFLYFFSFLYCSYNGLSTEVGDCTVPTINNLDSLLFLDILGISGFLIAYYLSFFLRVNFFIWLGSYSLKLYIIHPYIYFVYSKVGSYFYLNYIENLILSFMFVIIVFYIYLFSFKKYKTFDGFLFPKDIHSYFPPYK